MSTHGKDTHIAVSNAAGATQTISPYCSSVEWAPEQDIHDDTTFGNTGHTKRGGLTNGTFTINGFWDKTASVGPDVVFPGRLGDPTPRAFEYGPEGNASGKVKKTGLYVLSSYSVSSPVADLVTFTAVCEISGAVTQGTFT